MRKVIYIILLLFCFSVSAQSECTINIVTEPTPPTGCPEEPVFIGNKVIVYNAPNGLVDFSDILLIYQIEDNAVSTTFSVDEPCHAVYLASVYECCDIIITNPPNLVYEKCPDCEPEIIGFAITEGCPIQKTIEIRLGN